MDIGPGEPYNNRKLSFSVLLSDEKEYKGGDLELVFDINNLEVCSKQIGGAIFFPSFTMHRVTQVTEGIRDVLVGFFSGRPYR